MKPQALADKTLPILPLLACPLCGEPFSLPCFSLTNAPPPNSHSLICTHNHCFDLSRKGYINLAPSHSQQADNYHASLFECRRQLFQQGFYAPVMQAIGDAIAAYAPTNQPFAVLDAGCGEGSYPCQIANRFPQARVIGLDLSRDAITAAAKLSANMPTTNKPAIGMPAINQSATAESTVTKPATANPTTAKYHPNHPHWLIGNINRLPIRSNSLSFLLNILTPADYAEFSRVLRKDGILIKVIPGKDYLAEVRACISSQLQNDEYENERVFKHLQSHAALLERQSLRHTYTVTPEQAALFARMTPMTTHLSMEELECISFSQITIHLELVICNI